MTQILIIEDDLNVAKVLHELLDFLGYSVTLATSGGSAKQILSTLTPGLVFMDLSLPDIDGLTLLKEFRQCPMLSQIPIILVTATEPDSDQFPPPDTYQAIIPKPFDLEQIVEVTKEYLSQKEKVGAS